ncbi:MAG: sulfotransferase [Bacteroidota bacterium]
MAEFKLPPISTLAGSSLRNYFKVLSGNKIESRFYLKVFLSLLIILIGTPFRWIESLKFNQKIKKFEFEEPPLFILGHWRSGTTFLHNVLCQDPVAGYLTTYNSLFPHYLGSKWLFETFMSVTMPDKRPADNVKLDTRYPQEEEFSIGNVHPYSYYNFWYFPDRYKEYYDCYVRFKDKKVKEVWKEKYRRHIIKSLLDTNGRRAIFKNPVLTGRVHALTELFPNANFIHIYRNPVVVFLSTRKFFRELFPTLWFHEISNDEIDEMIFTTFIKMVNDFEEQKKLIPEGQLIEIKFEQFEESPKEHLSDIYSQLKLDSWELAAPQFEKYISAQKSYKKNNYKISQKDLDRVLHEWGFAMKLWNYEVPENLDVISP